MLTSASDQHTIKVAVPILVAVLSSVGVLGAALISVLFARLNEASRDRRNGYATAVQALVAWAEYPYRIRRRTSDEPAELRRLADLGHDLQEKLRYHQTWVAAESPRVGRLYASTLKSISAEVGPACMEAWASGPIITARAMNLGGWGPMDVAHHVEVLQKVITKRFGTSRLLPRRSRTNDR